MDKSTNDRGPPTYACVCSGISAPTLAAKPLRWKTKFFSEIEPFPRAVLSHQYPDIPLHGDFTTINGDTYGTVDILIGGTPCQSFSVAGKRLGLDDPRGNLALEYVRLGERLDAEWMVFENVPGLLSSGKPKGEDFAAFISAITGHEYRPPATGWKNAGIAVGKPGRWGIAWRILDAQYFGVAQRRRRLFVVGYRGDWRPAAAVLLEPESMRGNPTPRRGPQQEVAGTFTARAKSGGWCQNVDLASSGYMRVAGFGGGNCSGEIEVAACLTAKGVRQDFEVETFVTHTLRGDGFDASEDGTGRGTPIIPILEAGARTGTSTTDQRAGIGIGEPGDPMFTLSASKQHAVFPINTQMALRGPKTSNTSREGMGTGCDGDPGFTLGANHSHAVALSLRGREGGATAELSGDLMPAIRASQGGGDKPHVLLPSAVRRLTPRECERLQGMPDDYTLIPWRKKPAIECPDGPRYKAIGNSMAIPCIGWILARLDHVRRVV